MVIPGMVGIDIYKNSSSYCTNNNQGNVECGYCEKATNNAVVLVLTGKHINKDNDNSVLLICGNCLKDMLEKAKGL